jgi:hypothetical protein
MLDRANLEDRDLFLFNASVIAGALIFLTISAFVTRPEEQVYRLVSQAYGLIIIIIFSYSSWFLLRGSRKWGIISIFFGLGWTAAAAAFLFIMTVLNAKELLK